MKDRKDDKLNNWKWKNVYEREGWNEKDGMKRIEWEGLGRMGWIEWLEYLVLSIFVYTDRFQWVTKVIFTDIQHSYLSTLSYSLILRVIFPCLFLSFSFLYPSIYLFVTVNPSHLLPSPPFHFVKNLQALNFISQCLAWLLVLHYARLGSASNLRDLHFSWTNSPGLINSWYI